MGVLSKFRKKGRGFSDKTRTREEVNQEYNHHAVMFGHISRIIVQNQKLLDQHMEALDRLNEEGLKIPPDAPKSTPETKPEEPKPA